MPMRLCSGARLRCAEETTTPFSRMRPAAGDTAQHRGFAAAAGAEQAADGAALEGERQPAHGLMAVIGVF
jgi:hypothetical protein